jgi:uncharacterized protein (TIGR00369 family)
MQDTLRIRDLIERVTAMPGYTSSIGTQVVDVAPGEVSLRLPLRPELVQFNGHFHGGVVAGLADHAAGAAATSMLPPGRIAVTVSLNTNYVAPARGEYLLAKARTVQTGGTISVATVEVTAIHLGKETLAAIATVTLRAVELPST